MTQPEYPVASVIRLAPVANDPGATPRNPPLCQSEATAQDATAESARWVADGNASDIAYDLW